MQKHRIPVPGCGVFYLEASGIDVLMVFESFVNKEKNQIERNAPSLTETELQVLVFMPIITRKKFRKKIVKRFTVESLVLERESRAKSILYAGFCCILTLEARGIEPLSWTLLTQASPCSGVDCCISPVIRSTPAFHHSQEPVDVMRGAVPPPGTCLLS